MTDPHSSPDVSPRALCGAVSSVLMACMQAGCATEIFGTKRADLAIPNYYEEIMQGRITMGKVVEDSEGGFWLHDSGRET